MKPEQFEDAFDRLWTEIFSSPIHLDSALSKLTPKRKSLLAQIVPAILLRPASLAQSLGIGISPGEPWSLSREQLIRWRPARLIAARLHTAMVTGAVKTPAMAEDFPSWMREDWIATWGPEVTRSLIQALSVSPPTTIRVCRKFDPKTVLETLKKDSTLPHRAQLSMIAPQGIRFDGYVPILRTELAQRGEVEIQDEGSQAMAMIALWPELYGSLLNPKPAMPAPETPPAKLPPAPVGLTIVDACAGAGGKSLALADAIGGKGRIYSYDVSKTKLDALRRRATKAGVNCIQAVVLKDGQESDVISKFQSTADVVLVDAPCSGWGVLKRNADIKWRQEQDYLERMPATQLRLLSTFSQLVKPGGRLVYGLCTFRAAETTEVIEKFLETHPEFEKRSGGFIGPGSSDGFFVQVLERRK